MPDKGEIERHVRGRVEPYNGVEPGELLPYVPSGQFVDRQDYTVARPPANTRIQEKWSKVITPYRRTLLFRLWITYTWWRPAILFLILATIATLIIVAVA